MQKYISVICFIVFTLSCKLSASEISAFGAGNLNSSSPYGLSSDEKVIYSNKIALKQIKSKFFILKNQIDSLQERIDGLQTVLEGIGQASSKNQMSIKKISQQISMVIINQDQYQLKTNSSIDKDQVKINDINKSLSQVALLLNDINSSFITKSRLNLLIKQINDNYATKTKLNDLIKDINNFKSLMIKSLKKQYNFKETNRLSGMDNSLIYKDAYAFYVKHQYETASKYYKYLVKAHYMAATSNYMLGEISYSLHNYGRAIAYYKASALLYNKSKFMPTLMLHTATSMDKTGDISNAKIFFTALLTKYPSSKEAKIAKSSLKLLKP